MTDDASNIEHDCDRPYREVGAELVASAVAIAMLVRSRRPEVDMVPGDFLLTLHFRGGCLVIGKETGSQVVVVESVALNPERPETFGASDLPIVPSDRLAGPPTRH